MKNCEVIQEDVQVSDRAPQAAEITTKADQCRELSADEVEFAFGHVIWGT